MNANDTNAQRPAPQREFDDEAAASYERRIKAAGLDSDERLFRADGCVDMDAMRDRLSRKIAMFLNAWQGCPEPLCLRNRGCMAPSGLCSNVEEEEEWDEAEWARAKVEIRKALEEEIERRGGRAALEREE
jgi:hypothetical protein